MRVVTLLFGACDATRPPIADGHSYETSSIEGCVAGRVCTYWAPDGANAGLSAIVPGVDDASMVAPGYPSGLVGRVVAGLSGDKPVVVSGSFRMALIEAHSFVTTVGYGSSGSDVAWDFPLTLDTFDAVVNLDNVVLFTDHKNV